MAYTNAIFYIDLAGGGIGDGVRTTLSGVVFSNPSSTTVLGTKIAHGLVTGAVITVSGCTQAYANTAWKITWVSADTFTLDTALWASFNGADVTGDAVPFGGSSWSDAWLIITLGATVARIAPGDIIRISKTADPVGKGFATWTSLSKTVTLTAQTSCTFTDSGSTKVRVTKAGHNYSTGDVVTVSATESGTYDGTYAVTYVSSSTFDLDGTTYSADKTGTVTPALTATIDRCEADWSIVGMNGTSAAKLAVSTDAKEGSFCVKIVEDGTPSADQVQAFSATGTLNLSKYQKISFWIKNEVAILANQLEFNLCTGADGTGEVDVFPIPAIPSTGRWVCLTIAKNEGGNLNSAVASINISNGSNATTYTASKYVYIDNIIACTTNGLNLQSLISKNGAAQGGTEGFYGIQSIVGNTILLDLDTNTKANAGKGYLTSGTSPETVATYIRETFKTALAAASSTVVSDVMDSGTLGNNIQYQFGFQVGTTDQNGETFFDGLNGNGYALQLSSKSYVTLNYCAFTRYNYGVYFSNSSNNTVTTLTNANNNTYGVYFSNSSNNTVTTLTNANNNTYGVYFNSSSNNTVTTITNANNNSSGVIFSSSSYNTVTTITNANNNTNYGVYFGYNSNDTVTTITNANNNTYGVYFSYSSNDTVTTITNANNNTYGVYFSNSSNNTVTTLTNANNNTYGVYFGYSSNNTVTTITNANNNTNYGVYFGYSSNNKLKVVSSTGGTGFYSDVETNYFINSTFLSTEFASTTNPVNNWIWSLNHDNTEDNHWGFTYQATVNWQVATKYGSQPGSWKTAITGSTRNSGYPIKLKVAEIPIKGNGALTVTAWVKKDHATDILARLVAYANQTIGNAEATTTKANDVDWQELTITITPTLLGTTVKAVIEIYLETYYVTGNSNSYIGTITASQA
jgi:parallel beta-helix repeat protein